LIICRAAAWATRNVPNRFTPTTKFQSSSVMSTKGGLLLQPAERGHGVGHHLLHLGPLRNVGGDGDPLGAERGHLRLRLRGGVAAGQVVDGDVRPLGREPLGQRLADPAVGPGDQRDLVLQTHGVAPLCECSTGDAPPTRTPTDRRGPAPTVPR
jgi:hypothetical protein